MPPIHFDLSEKVPAASLFHAKDVVDAPPGGPCSPAVLRCLAALSDAVRENAAADHPGDVYDGALLGDEDGGGGAIKEEEEEEEEEHATAVFARGGFGGGGGAGGANSSILSSHLASKMNGNGDGNIGSSGGRVVGGIVVHHDVDGSMTAPDSSTLSIGPGRFVS